MSSSIARIATACLVLTLPSLADAQLLEAHDPVVVEFSRRFRPEMKSDEFLAAARRVFDTYDFDADGAITIADIEALEAQSEAHARADIVKHALQADSNGDGVITQEEVIRYETLKDQRHTATGRHIQQQPLSGTLQSRIDARLSADFNRDGVIEWPELLRYASIMRPTERSYRSSFESYVRLLMTIDQDRDGKTTAEEFERVIRAMFDRADSDGDGALTQREITEAAIGSSSVVAATVPSTPVQSFDRRILEQREKDAKARADCSMPPASESAKVMLVSAYRAGAVSTTTIGSQNVAVETAYLAIEPGDEPLYVVASTFRPTIWRLTGAVQRVERLVLAGQMTGSGTSALDEIPLVGALGISTEKVTFLRRSQCIASFREAPSVDSARAAGLVRSHTGRDPTLVAARDMLIGIDLPSGRIQTPPGRRNGSVIVFQKDSGTLRIEGDPSRVILQTGSDSLQSKVQQFYPGGVVDIAPEVVVASKKPERYEVLPGQAGLLQLVEAGSMRENSKGEFLVTRKTRFPAELHGAHSEKFVILRGVPVPDGDPGHSCVIIEETGRPLSGLNCR